MMSRDYKICFTFFEGELLWYRFLLGLPLLFFFWRGRFIFSSSAPLKGPLGIGTVLTPEALYAAWYTSLLAQLGQNLLTFSGSKGVTFLLCMTTRMWRQGTQKSMSSLHQEGVPILKNNGFKKKLRVNPQEVPEVESGLDDRLWCQTEMHRRLP